MLVYSEFNDSIRIAPMFNEPDHQRRQQTVRSRDISLAERNVMIESN